MISMKRRDVLKVIAATTVAGSFGMRAGVAMAATKRMVVIHKIAGIPWVNMMSDGVVQGGKKFGIDASLIGPATPDPAQQVKLIEDVIAQKVDVIGLVPLDEKVCAPSLKRAQEAGIKVITLEGPNQEGRDWNVDLVNSHAFGEVQMQRLAAAMGEKGQYVVYVGTLTTPLHNVWADSAIAYQKAHYPNMTLATDRFPGGDEVDVSQRTTLDVVKAYPDVRGILAEGSNGPIGAGNAIKQLHMEKKIAVVGTCVPSQAQALLKNKIIRECTLWNPSLSGYAMVAVAKLMLDGTPIVADMEIADLGKASIDPTKKSIQFDKMLEITIDNVDSLVASGL
jgi:simple sugar transport system substrate-binding protein